MTDVNRYIAYYERDGDKFIGEIPLTNIALNDLLSLIPKENYKDDLELCKPYILDKAMLEKIALLDNQTFHINLDLYEYYREIWAK
jgi:hypothetical protein